ncbi:hypothetical protein [Helicobacter pylori]|uniref:hypothetical protein n=1 Tax=Helicobacter pylori TaxID=210 RepID=UPI00214BEE18|nr:hypothetical protein [Helicobacter pylori]
MQMLFDKINNGSPFIGFVEIVIRPIESLFFVYENEPSTTFNLKNYLLVLAKYIYSEKICYCENKQDKNMHNMKNIKLLSTGRHDFGKDLDSINVELSNPNTFVQSLLKLGSFLHGKTIEFFDNPTNYPPITLPPLQIPVEIEEHRKNTTFDQNYNSLYYRQSSAQNIKINEIANDLESGKIVGEKIISDALLGVVSCCFMDDKNLKNLKKLLSQDQINLSNVITTAINNANAFEINEINLTSAHFIFNVSNNFLSGKSRLTIEVPRVKLENIKLPDMKEIYVNQWYINIFINTLIFSINEGSYTLTGV